MFVLTEVQSRTDPDLWSVHFIYFFLCLVPFSYFQRSHHSVHCGRPSSDPARRRPCESGGQEPVRSTDGLSGYRQRRWDLPS